jgi:hypothetical protein
MASTPNDDRSAFNSALQALEAEVANIGAHLSIDGEARLAYERQIRQLSLELQAEATAGRITWAEAARKANAARNAVMEFIRARSSPVGLAIAQRLKPEGVTLNELIAKKAVQIHGPGIDFNRLTPGQQNAVYAEIVKSAGKANPRVSATVRTLSRGGRGLVVLSVGMSAYTVMTADDKAEAAKREAVVTGAGIGGGVAGGALAGLACGPGAPVCVTVGAFVGGALAAFGVDYLW